MPELEDDKIFPIQEKNEKKKKKRKKKKKKNLDKE